VRWVTRLVGRSIDAVIVPLVPVLGEPGTSAAREATLAALDGALGDYLADTGNPLAIPMCFRQRGEPLLLDRATLADRFAQPSGKLLIMLHGLCMNDLQWQGDAPADHSAAMSERLANDLGCTPLYLHYNTGQHISLNGQAFGQLMQQLVSEWPVPVNDIVLLTHSMGGLLARSALQSATAAGLDWPQHVSRVVFLGTPHHGAPLERGGNWIDFLLNVSPYTAPFARLGNIRSAGITDLRFGNVQDEDWQGHDRFARKGDRRKPLPLPPQIACFALAATTGKRSGDLGDRLVGDGLVTVASALGQHDDPAMTLAIPATRQRVVYGINHFALLNHPKVYCQLRRWLLGDALT
jgi:hypothetical protein